MQGRHISVTPSSRPQAACRGAPVSPRVRFPVTPSSRPRRRIEGSLEDFSVRLCVAVFGYSPGTTYVYAPTFALGRLYMKKYLFHIFATLALAISAIAVPSIASARTSTFYGITLHVSTTNIKVRNPHTGQVLSFEILPKFDRIFSDNGKTTYQMKAVKPGRYVGIIYDQSMLGMRHADAIYLLNNENERIGKQ